MKTKQKCNIACVVIYCFLTFRNKRKTIHFNVYCSRQYQIFSLGCFACRSLSSVKCYGISSLAPSCASWFLTLKVFLLSFFSCILFLASKSRLANAKEFFTLHVCIYIIKLNIAIGIFELPEKVDPRSVKLLNQKPRMNIP